MGRRYSCDKDDPGYMNFVRARDRGADVLVFLNGHSVDDVVTADETEGLILRFAKDGKGNLRVDLENDRVVTETLCGTVRVVERERTGDAP